MLENIPPVLRFKRGGVVWAHSLGHADRREPLRGYLTLHTDDTNV
jgi:hypothetical protein